MLAIDWSHSVDRVDTHTAPLPSLTLPSHNAVTCCLPTHLVRPTPPWAMISRLVNFGHASLVITRNSLTHHSLTHHSLVAHYPHSISHSLTHSLTHSPIVQPHLSFLKNQKLGLNLSDLITTRLLKHHNTQSPHLVVCQKTLQGLLLRSIGTLPCLHSQ